MVDAQNSVVVKNSVVFLEAGETGAIEQEDVWSFSLQYVLIAKRNVKYLFALREISRSTAVTVLVNKNRDATLNEVIVQAEIFEEMLAHSESINLGT